MHRETALSPFTLTMLTFAYIPNSLSHLLKKKKKMVYSCFAMLLVSAVCIHISPSSWTSPAPIPPSRSVITGHWDDQPMLPSIFPLAIYFTHRSIYISMLVSPSPTVSHYPFSTPASLFLPCKSVHLYHLSRFHTHALIYNTCFSLSDLPHLLWRTLGPSASL